MVENIIYIDELVTMQGSKLTFEPELDLKKIHSASEIVYSTYRPENEAYDEENIHKNTFHNITDRETFNHKDSSIPFYELRWLAENFKEAKEYLKFTNFYFKKKAYFGVDMDTKFFFPPSVGHFAGAGGGIISAFRGNIDLTLIAIGGGIVFSEGMRQIYKHKGKKALNTLLPQYEECMEAQEKIYTLPVIKNIYPKINETIHELTETSKEYNRDYSVKNLSINKYLNVEKKTNHRASIDYEKINKMLLETYAKNSE